ncbi:MAG: hypothetical protein POH28_01055 [Acidocella sp.]|nr:hypothetical protein [Acidocella sp.]
MKNLTHAQAETLVSVIRTLCPHECLDISIYRRAVSHFDRLAAAAEVAGTIDRFCEAIVSGWPLAFGALAETYRVQALQRLQETAEFMFVQRMAVRYLYDDVEVWAAFGYQGASVHLGGYVGRGFNDLDWLPDLPNDL